MAAFPEVEHVDQLYIPGPIDVRPEVLEAMAMPPYGHRVAEEMGPYIASIRENLFALVNASEDTHSMVLTGGSGTSALEIAARSWSSEGSEPRVLSTSIGYFGNLWGDIFEACGTRVDRLESEAGEIVGLGKLFRELQIGEHSLVTVTHNDTSTGTVNPLEAVHEAIQGENPDTLFFVDAVSSAGGMPIDVTNWGIDFLATAPQKGLGVPPGLALAVVSKRALERVSAEGRGFTTDVIEQIKANEDDMTLTTPPEAQIGALALQLAYIVEEEGIGARYERHASMADTVRHWGNGEGFELLPYPENSSSMLSCFVNTRLVDLKAIQTAARDAEPTTYSFDAGHPKLSRIRRELGLPDTFRIAHMGDRSPNDLDAYLETLSALINQ